MIKTLVVDDNPDTRYLTAHILKNLGCNVIEFPDAETALMLLRAANPFKVIFTDLYMPKINGIEFLNEIKRMYPDSSVVLISSLPHTELHDQAVAAGASNCIFQQHTLDQYRNVLQQVLQ